MDRIEGEIAMVGEFSVSVPGASLMDPMFDFPPVDEFIPEILEQPEKPEKPEKKAKKKAKGHNKRLGQRGEDAAVRFLARRGYDILERNWTCDAGEADIICRDNDCLVFVEVKTRMDEDRGLPEDAVGAQKRQRYERIAASYLRVTDFQDMQIRFDVIAILVLSEDRAMIRHHINAFGVA